MSNVDVRISRLAARQGGAFSRCQAEQAGAHPSLIHRRRLAGRWLPAMTGVFVVAGSPCDERQRKWIAWLSLGETMVFSHESAGRSQRLPGIRPGVDAVTVRPGDHRRRSGLIVHQQLLAPDDVIVVDGFPTTTVCRTV